MAEITLQGEQYNTCGNLPEISSIAPNFSLTRHDLTEVTLDDFTGLQKLLYILPSLDTPVCQKTTRYLEQQSKSIGNVAILIISADLPFAMARFHGAEEIKTLHLLSSFRSTFADDYGIAISNGPLRGITARALLALSVDNSVRHCQLVSEVSDSPDFERALADLAG